MRKHLMTLFSVLFIASGLVLSMWVATGMLAKARSQEAPTMNAPPGAPDANIPPPAAMDPNAVPVPPSTQQLPESAPQMPAPPVDQPAIGRPAEVTQGFVPDIPGSDGYVYDPTGKRDPFRPFGMPSQMPFPLDAPKDLSTLLPPIDSSDPLQTYDLSQLKVVGIIWQVSSPKAVVRDPVGKIHMIRKDTKIGRNNGFVSQIREGEVLVVEPMIGEGGLPTATTRVMAY